MNKTNYIILTIVLCFSLAFVAYPLRFTSAYMTENGGDTTGDTTIDNSIISEDDFNDLWDQSQSNIETNNPGGHSNIYTDTEVIPEDVELSTGWIEGVGVWGIVVEPEEDGNGDEDGGDGDGDGTPPPPVVTPPPVSPTPVTPPTPYSQPQYRCRQCRCQ